MKLSSILSFFYLFIFQFSFSQDTYLDKIYEEARNLAFSNDYPNARKICYQILNRDNNYLDARILLARTFSWDHKYDSARYHLKTVLQQDASAVDAYLAYADIEIWSQNYSKAVSLCDSGLMIIPDSYDLFIKKIKASLLLEDVAGARSTINNMLRVYPMNLEIQNLLKQSRQGNFKNRFILEHTYEFFRRPYIRRWHVTSLQYHNEAKWGTFIAKANAGQLIPAGGELFNPGAMQYEADIYPLLGKGFYAYLNYGHSDGTLFPKDRGGLELFKTFRNGFEISAGARYLYFNMDEEAFVFTGTLTKYLRSLWFSFRPYYAFVNENYRDQSYFIFFRKYSSPYSYFGGMAGYGISPDLIPASSGIYENHSLDSYQFRIDVQQRLGKHFLFRSLTGYAFDQYTQDEFRHRFNVQLYLAVVF